MNLNNPGRRIRSQALRAFRKLPKELFRVSNGRLTHLRKYSPEHDKIYDVILQNGKVKPKALDLSKYTAPNGASMRPLCAAQFRLVRSLRGENAVIYCVAQGTTLPEDLIVVRESHFHYSLQTTKETTLEELNQRITSFLEAHSITLNRQDWLNMYESTEDVQI